MIDFGLAERLNSQTSTMNQTVGSPYYIAPETLKADYNMKCDLWAMGVLMYVLLVGDYPFQGETHEEIYKNI